MDDKSFFKLGKCLPIVSITIFLLLASNSKFYVQEDYGECPDHIVKLDNTIVLSLKEFIIRMCSIHDSDLSRVPFVYIKKEK